MTYPEYAVVINTVVSLSGRLDEDRLRRAIRLSLEIEPVLGCKFIEHWFRPYWQRHENFDELELCDVRSNADFRTALIYLTETPLDTPLQVLVFRGNPELLCIRLDHRLVDGKAAEEYAYLLTDIYNRLVDNHGYTPVPNTNSSRSTRQIWNQFGFREKWRVVRDVLKESKRLRLLGKWIYPLPMQGSMEFDCVLWQLDAERLSAISEFARRQRATMTQVLVAAFYLAAHEAMAHSSNLPLPIVIPVDLRRYLPAKKPANMSNLTGLTVIAVEVKSGDSLEDVVRRVRDQMYSQRKEHLGLTVGTFPYESLPFLRHIAGIVPYCCLKRIGRRLFE